MTAQRPISSGAPAERQSADPAASQHPDAHPSLLTPEKTPDFIQPRLTELSIRHGGNFEDFS